MRLSCLALSAVALIVLILEFPSVDEQLGKEVIHVTETRDYLSTSHTHRHKAPSHWHIVQDSCLHTHTHIHTMCASCTSSNVLVVYGHAQTVTILTQTQGYIWMNPTKFVKNMPGVLFHSKRNKSDITL